MALLLYEYDRRDEVPCAATEVRSLIEVFDGHADQVSSDKGHWIVTPYRHLPCRVASVHPLVHPVDGHAEQIIVEVPTGKAPTGPGFAIDGVEDYAARRKEFLVGVVATCLSLARAMPATSEPQDVDSVLVERVTA